MKPLSFAHITARAFIGDTDARGIESAARLDADKKCFSPPTIDESATYANRLRDNMRVIVYRAQYTSKLARNERKQ